MESMFTKKLTIGGFSQPIYQKKKIIIQWEKYQGC